MKRTMILMVVTALFYGNAAFGQGEKTNSVPGATNTNHLSGIRGRVIIGPLAPVTKIGQTNSRPLPEAWITVQKELQGKEIARQRADQNGQFELFLPAGEYWVTGLPPEAGKSRRTGKPRRVQVKRNGFTELTVMIDTGIR